MQVYAGCIALHSPQMLRASATVAHRNRLSKQVMKLLHIVK